jgi:hypothetical protein
MSKFTRRQLAQLAPGSLLLSLATRGAAAPAVPSASGAIPARIVLTWAGDPARTQAVTWRTEIAAAAPQAQVAKFSPDPKFEPSAITVRATFEKDDLGDGRSAAHYAAAPDARFLVHAGDLVAEGYDDRRLDVTDAGIGTFDLVSRGYHLQTTNQTVQATESAVLGAAVNETRVQYFRSANETVANSSSPAILVLGAFNGGGSQTGQTSNTQNSVELQNHTSILHGAHAVRFGVRFRGQGLDSVSPQNFGGAFTFAGIERYQVTLQLQQQGLSPAQIRAAVRG